MTLPIWARDAPDRILYGTNAPGKWELFAWDRTTGVRRQVTDRVAGTWPEAGRIHPTGRTIWWFDDERGNEFGRWIIEPFEGGGARVAVSLPPAYRAGAVLARQFAVIGRSDGSGTTIHLVDDRGRDGAVLYHHREHAWVADISRDDTLIAVNHSEHGDMRHPAVRVVDTEGRAVADLQDEPGRGLVIRAWSPVPGDQRLILTHERGDVARPLIFEPLTGGTLSLELDLPGELDAGWYPDASAVLITHHFRGRSELFRMELAGMTLSRIHTLPGTIAGARVHPDGTVWRLWSNAERPAEVYAGGEAAVLESGDPAAPRSVPYTDAAVGDVHVFVAEPPSPRPHPTIMLIHGGPAAHDRDMFSPPVQAWADHGFAVLLVNYRGSSGYGRRWRDALQGNPGFTELEDIVRVREWALTGGLADPSRLILAGASWGGYLTLLGLGRHPGLWSLGIAAVPLADILTAYEDEMEPLKAYDRALFGGAPDEIPEAYRLRSPITYADQVRVPVLILAGDNDPRCPIRQVERYLAALHASGKVHEFYRYEAGHGAPVVEEAIRQIERQLAFAARHLSTPAPR